MEIATRQIGQKVSDDEKVYKILLPEILATDGANLYSFGQGLGDKCLDFKKMWQDFRQQLEVVDDEKRNYQVLRGFLNSISKINIQSSEELLNEAVFDSVLGRVFPLLQFSVELNERGVERLKQSLGHGSAPLWILRYLGHGKTHESINDTMFNELLSLIASKPDGLAVAIEILAMRLHGQDTSGYVCTEAIKTLGQELLNKVRFDHDRSTQDRGLAYNLSRIAGTCLFGATAKAVARNLCIRLGQAFVEHKIYSKDYTSLLDSLASKQPLAFLEGFLGDNAVNKVRLKKVFSDEITHDSNPLSKISDNFILEWCKSNPNVRYPIVASCIASYKNGKDDEAVNWAPLALMIINTAPDPTAVLNNLKSAFSPRSWSGSRSKIMSKRLGLLSILKDHENPVVAEWARDNERIFEDEISSERRWESDRNVSQYEHFE